MCSLHLLSLDITITISAWPMNATNASARVSLMLEVQMLCNRK